MGGDMSPYWISGAKPQPPNVFLDRGLRERWMRESRCYFILSCAQKVGGMVPLTPKSGGTHTP